jgi:hypothetical protein
LSEIARAAPRGRSTGKRRLARGSLIHTIGWLQNFVQHYWTGLDASPSAAWHLVNRPVWKKFVLLWRATLFSVLQSPYTSCYYPMSQNLFFTTCLDFESHG